MSTLTESQQDLELDAGQVPAVPVELSGDLEQLPPILNGSLQLQYETRAGLHHQEEDLIEADHYKTFITLLKTGGSGGAGQGAPLYIIHSLCKIQASV